MIQILAAVLIGILLALTGILKAPVLKFNGKIQVVWLMLLIFSMGVGIGNNTEVTSNIAKLGGDALFYAVSSVIGSVIVVVILTKLFFKGGEKK